MSRAELNTNSKTQNIEANGSNSSIYSYMNPQMQTQIPERIVVEYRGDWLFTVNDIQTFELVEVQLIPFGKRCLIRFNNLGWFDLVKISKFTQILPKTEQVSRTPDGIYEDGHHKGIAIHCDDGDVLEIIPCSLEMFGSILEQLRPHVERYIDHYHRDISNIYDQYGPRIPWDYRQSIPFTPSYRSHPPQQRPTQQPIQPSATDRHRMVEEIRTSPRVPDIPHKKKKSDLWKLGSKSKNEV
jgi:hypothetical protein